MLSIKHGIKKSMIIVMMTPDSSDSFPSNSDNFANLKNEIPETWTDLIEIQVEAAHFSSDFELMTNALLVLGLFDLVEN